MDVSALLGTIQNAKGLYTALQSLRDTKTALEQVELEKKLVELMATVVDIQAALIESTQTLQGQGAEIERLQKALELQGELGRAGDAYFRVDPNGKTYGDPICTYCWESESRIYHLTTAEKNPHGRVCPHCKHVVTYARIQWPEGTPEEPHNAAIRITRS